MANTDGSLVCIFSFTIIPPLAPTSIPQAFANSSLGLMPAEITSISTSNCVSSLNCIAAIFSSPIIFVVFLLRCILRPSSANLDFSISLPAVSICLGINRGANSMICVSAIPRSIKAFAASKPNNPPPITAPFFAFLA
ncbi:hypothetical protein D3C85_1204520 [compost metagenome]